MTDKQIRINGVVVTPEEVTAAAARWHAERERQLAEVWQPIESAPKEEYICGAQRWGSRWRFHQMWWDESTEEWTDVSSDLFLNPEFWAPLPGLK